MNAHNKTQFTYAKIKCVPKESSCDTPISKNLMLTILASNASSSSTKFQNQMQHSLSQGRTQCILSAIGLPVFSDQHLFQLTQDIKGLFKACNRAECKGKAQGVFKNGSHTHKKLPKIMSKPYLVNRTNGENSRIHHAWFKVSSSHKVLTLQVKQDSTVLLVCTDHHKRLNSILG
ncbi:hypothetical protein H5410_021658 [Solanum commersonii]|uniref:Uncharacterized protein n=1 Tax=Solanum commersonii TaxID=4109 RepID=A0A9J5ZBY5_SOLCO|nr:hypothetical protein H5410_021658 [Solanum commersonii]